MKTAILVDVSNIYYALRDSTRGRVKYDRLMEWAKRQGELVAAIAFAPYDPDRPEQRAFLNALSMIGFRVDAQPIRRGEEADGSEIPRMASNIDVALAIEAVHLARLVDQVLLVSGDGDFTRLVQFLAQQGKIVWVIASRTALSVELARAAHRVILLEELDREIPGLIERSEDVPSDTSPVSPAPISPARETAPAPEKPVPPGPIEALLRQTAKAMAELAREYPGRFSVSLIGSRNPSLAEQARPVGRLSTMVALALLDGVLPGWGIVMEGSELMVRPGRASGAALEQLREMVQMGWTRIPPLAVARPVIKVLALLDPPASSPRELEDQVRERLQEYLGVGDSISRTQTEMVLDALRIAGAIRPGPDGLEWERHIGQLEDALRHTRLELIKKRLAQESPAFQKRVLQRLGLLADSHFELE